MDELKIYENEEFGKLRLIDLNNKPAFIAKDITDILGYQNSRKAIADHVDDEDKGVTNCYTLGGYQQMTVINESGLYSLILSSKLASAKRFKRWVTSEVLPSIRQNGGYIAGQESLSDEELLSKALMVAQNKIAERDRLLKEQEPKVLFANSVATSKTSILVGELAKILKQNGYEIGQNRLFDLLRKKGYLTSRRGTDFNMPTQKSMDLGLFQIKETDILHADGHISICKTPKITGRGQVYFINKFYKGELI
jgi:anti-repressor protein